MYDALGRGVSPALSALPFQYADWAVAESALKARQAERLEQRVQQLLQAPTRLDFPARKPGPSSTGTWTFSPVPALAAAVAQISIRAGVSQPVIWIAAYALLVSQLAHERVVLVGMPVSMRKRARGQGQQADALCGYFLSTQPLPIDTHRVFTVDEYLQHCQLALGEAEEASHLHLDDYASAMGVDSPDGGPPLIQALCTVGRRTMDTVSLAGMRLTPCDMHPPHPKFPVTLHVQERLDGPSSLVLEYDDAIFESAHMQTYGERVQNTVLQFAVSGACPLGQLHVTDVSPAEASTGVESLSLPQRFWKYARAHPEAMAISGFAGDQTYAELSGQALTIMRALDGLDLDEVVVVVMPKGPALIAAIMACGFAGVAVAPLDVSNPLSRIEFVLNDSCAKAVLVFGDAVAGVQDVARRLDVPVIDVEALPILPPEALPSPRMDVCGENLVYLLYTSGSTGQPKGVAFPHAAMANLVDWKQSLLPNPRARVLQFSSIGFDAALQEIYNSLSQGDCLVLLPEGVRSDPAAVHDLMKAHAVDHVYMPYVALSVLADYVGGLEDGYWPSEIFTAGEQLVVTDGLKRVYRRFPGSRLHNFYGPTETHVVTAHALPADAESWPDLPSIGTAIDHTRIHVLDAAMTPVPLGGIGELYAGGLCLARGYLNRPGLTAERFLADPYGPPGTRMYATGDLVRRCVDGTIEFLGRRDGQVKIRGYRVEPVEVETTLSAQLPGAEALAVVAHQTGADTRLICFAKPQAGVELTPEMMQAAAVASLPSYMRPYANILVDAFPYTTSGKLDRRTLAGQISLQGHDKTEKRQPETDLQRTLCQAMGAILGRDAVGLDDNFFALGGASLDAMRLLVRLTTDLGVRLSASDIFMAPTVAELAQRIEQGDKMNSQKRSPLRKGQGVKFDA